MISNELLAELMQGRKAKPAGKATIWLEGADGPQVINRGVSETVGKFEGNVGSVKRSRKGRTSRMPNGSRYYCRNYDVEVIAYKLH